MADAKPLRIVHTSDVHLGAFSGREAGVWEQKRDRMHTGFRAVVDLAIREDAGALIIAGDFFDNDRVASDVVDFAIAEIRRYGRPAFVVPGNHDPMDPGKLYWRRDFEAEAPNLRIIREHAGEVFEADALDLVLWGRAYIDTDYRFRPLDGLPERFDRRWHVAMAHGHFVPDGERNDRSMPIHEEEIAGKAGHWDYFAFGHWEAHADVSTRGATAVYSGAPVALSDANTKSGWAMVVDFSADGVRWEKHRVDPGRPE